MSFRFVSPWIIDRSSYFVLVLIWAIRSKEGTRGGEKRGRGVSGWGSRSSIHRGSLSRCMYDLSGRSGRSGLSLRDKVETPMHSFIHLSIVSYIQLQKSSSAEHRIDS